MNLTKVKCDHCFAVQIYLLITLLSSVCSLDFELKTPDAVLASKSSASTESPWLSSSSATSSLDSSSPSRHRVTQKAMLETLGWNNYPRYHEMTLWLHRITELYSDIAQLYSIGKSAEKRDLWVVKISKDVSIKRPVGKPMFKYVGNIHGNEALSRQLLLYLIQHLLSNYGKDDYISRLVNSTEIHICPSMNPDGYERSKEGDCTTLDGRNNANNKDLNRDFPDQWAFNSNSSYDQLTENRQPETLAAMSWLVSNPFVLSASLHSGTVVASYPFDDSSSHQEVGFYSKSPDDDLFKQLAATYASHHPTMKSGHVCVDNFFDSGITNGAKWYDLSGGMQDFNYIFTNCFEITVELSCCKYPFADKLANEWKNNTLSLLKYIEQVHSGVKGVVIDSITRDPIEKAVISVEGIDHSVVTTRDGEFWRLLTPGQYNITVRALGYTTLVRADIRVDPLTDSKLDAQWLQLELDPISKFDLTHKTLKGERVFIQPFTSDTTSEEWQASNASSSPRFIHRNHVQMTQFLHEYAAKYPHISRLYSIGKSVEGRDLWVMEISDNSGVHEVTEPEFKYVANMHGNEVVGKFLCLLLIQTLLESYASNQTIRKLVDETRIHILPSMNPDGFAIAREGDCNSNAGRYNARGIDLNRNFPDQYGTNFSVELTEPTQPETQAMMDWITNNSFVLSASLHGGSLVANYPFDGSSLRSERPNYSASPDDATFRYLALTYSKAHESMWVGKPCEKECTNPLMGKYFPNGITNGAEWYPLYGGMQDFNYLHSNCFEITVELGCVKYPLTKDLPKYWKANQRALIAYLQEVHRGIKGVITDEHGYPVPRVAVVVEGIDHVVHSASNGDYWRLLSPASYKVSFVKEGFESHSVDVTIIPYDWAQVINVTLKYSSAVPPKYNQEDFVPHKIFGIPKPIFIIAIAALLLAVLISSLFVFNLLQINSSHYSRKSSTGRRTRSVFAKNNPDPYREYEYAKFTSNKLLAGANDYISTDESDSEDELLNVSAVSPADARSADPSHTAR